MKKNMSILKHGKRTGTWEDYCIGHVNKLGQWVPQSNVGSVLAILAYHEEWNGTLGFDTFTQRIVWRRGLEPLAGRLFDWPKADEEFIDAHTTMIQVWMLDKIGVKFTVSDVEAGALLAAKRNSYSSVEEYLKRCHEKHREANGQALPTWLADYCSVERNPLSLMFGRLWMIAAVARACRPGCQVDNVLVLEGEQGVRKTSILRTLGGRWYQGSLADIRDPVEAAYRLRGKWIIDLSELDALKHASNSRIKAFLDATQDSVRWKYARTEETVQRSCIFASTTNHSEYLTDSTGGRRFWPVLVAGRVDIPRLEDARDKLWGEAYSEWKSGSAWWIEDEWDEGIVHEQQMRKKIDPWARPVREYAETVTGSIRIGDVIAHIGVELQHVTVSHHHRVAAILRDLGWAPRRTKKYRFWEKKQ